MSRFAGDVDPKMPLAEYPRPQMVRERWQNLNGLWQFEPAEEIKDAPVGKELSGRVLVPFCMESALSGVGKHHDRSWYRRTFSVPQDWRKKGDRVLLHFGAVDYESTVWVNGKEQGKHVGGYDAFKYDITDALKSEGEQELIVGVTDTTAETQPRGKQVMNPRGIWYTPVSGIWQTVWIEPVPEAHIESIKLTPDVDAGELSVEVQSSGATSAPDAQQFTIDVLEDGKRVAGSIGPSGVVRIKLPDAKLWSPEQPHLYDLRITMADARGTKDELSSYFGMRKIEVSPDDKGIPRIKLNGKELMQVGPLDQGWWPDGLYTAPTDEALKYDIEMTKKLGFNMIRKHVKVEPQRWYHHADKLGLLVWQDMPNAHAYEAGEWQKQFEHELKEMIQEHVNSPAIIMWVPLNEGWGQDARKKEDGTTGKAPYDKQGTIALGDNVKSWDPTRLVNHASGWTDYGGGDVHDIHNYPGPAAPPIEKKRAIVLGEFGGLGLPIEGHLWQDKANWGYQNMQSREELTDKYVRLLGRLWQLHEDAGLCAGVYTQTTDVETEVNGFLTYDRAVLKMDEQRMREANLGKGPRVDVVPLVKTAQEEPAEWKHTTADPGEGWMHPGFDDSKWKTGKSGFGTQGTPGAVVNTKWDTSDIWLRREIDIPADVINDVAFLWHHDEAAQVYVNGALAARSGQHTTGYVEQRMREEGRKALKPGKNLIAVHCRQTTGGQYIDVGLVRLVEKKRR
ncbi:MAG TPA: glycoside hydrolase family 2 TIM barrel-domain containing protein [Tepidisphaeraceae bacterium]|nr:glycoside hydrolase family 2 TIM barrel-domain containing protein [Tepidisphaeraceae bacterium]